MTAPAIITALGGVSFLAALIAAFLKARPEKESLVITSAQGAATILNDIIRALREELEHERSERQRDRAAYDEEVARLRLELQRATGRRR